jgi:hypothetical protein
MKECPVMQEKVFGKADGHHKPIIPWLHYTSSTSTVQYVSTLLSELGRYHNWVHTIIVASGGGLPNVRYLSYGSRHW